MYHNSVVHGSKVLLVITVERKSVKELNNIGRRNDGRKIFSDLKDRGNDAHGSTEYVLLALLALSDLRLSVKVQTNVQHCLQELVKGRDLAVNQMRRCGTLRTELSFVLSMEVVRCHSHCKVD